MKFTYRISIVVLCYLLSSYGIVLSLMLVGMAGVTSLAGMSVGGLILFAWICHVVMSMNWVLDRPLGRWVPRWGSLAGILGLVLWPVANPAIERFEVADALHALAMGVGFTLPCCVLALFLVRFHLQRGGPVRSSR